MNDNETGIKDVKALNFKESEITLSETKSFDTGEVEIIFPIRSTQSQIKEYIELSELYIQDVEPPKYVVQQFEEQDYVITGNGNLNGLPLNYQITTQNIKDKKYPHDKIVTLDDLNTNNSSNNINLIKGGFEELYIVGFKPIILENSVPYIEPEITNHNDFMFMILCPFLALMLVLGLRKKYKKKK